MTQTTEAVTHSVLVPLEPGAAFELFTDRFADWWPKDSHHIGQADAADVFLSRARAAAGTSAPRTAPSALGARARDRPAEPHPAGLAPDAGMALRPDPAKATQSRSPSSPSGTARPA